ncbi:hypothetical protein TELCIR_07960 [Teladorsagia circumcincta]|uniref:Amino acid transporter transmembrane domain-containing protein n=1 Tax=Teladorsagia circumcincta TaxID=45464 RepID=A0A2G9UKC9_TELCI|nr:hypothetical protein TELCIR_07960 [Teladorsagia circumcincta]
MNTDIMLVSPTDCPEQIKLPPAANKENRRKDGVSATAVLTNFICGMMGPGCFSVALSFEQAGLWELIFHEKFSHLSLPAVTNFSGVTIAAGGLMYAFEGQAMVLALENRLKMSSDMIGLTGVLSTSMNVVMLIYAFLGFFGYLTFGPSVAGSLTLNLSNSGQFTLPFLTAFGDPQQQAVFAGAFLFVVGVGMGTVFWMLVERRRHAQKLELLREQEKAAKAAEAKAIAKAKAKQRKIKKIMKKKRYKKPPPPVKASKLLKKTLAQFLESQTQSIASEMELEESTKPPRQLDTPATKV